MPYPTTTTFDSQPCYFTITTNRHCADETPCSPTSTGLDEIPLLAPEITLLALRERYLLSTITTPVPYKSVMSASASHSHSPSRPQPVPLQNVLDVSSDDSSSSDDGSCSSYDNLLASPSEYARCSRCQRTPSLDINTGKSNMVRYGLNSYYCNRCAGMVGLVKR